MSNGVIVFAASLFTGLPACFLLRHVEEHLAIQRNLQVPKRWFGWGDMTDLGVLALFAWEKGGWLLGDDLNLHFSIEYSKHYSKLRPV